MLIQLESVTRVRITKGVKDSLGVPAEVQTTAAVAGCSLQPVSSSELDSNSDLVVGLWHLFAPVTADIVSTDQIVDESGTKYNVDGDPRMWRDLYGRPHHLEVTLRLAKG